MAQAIAVVVTLPVRPPYYPIVADYTGGIWLEFYGADDDGTTISSEIKTMYDDLNAPKMLKQWDWIRFDGVSQASAVTITLYTKDENGTAATTTLSSQTFPLLLRNTFTSIKRWVEFYFDIVGFDNLRSITGRIDAEELI